MVGHQNIGLCNDGIGHTPWPYWSQYYVSASASAVVVVVVVEFPTGLEMNQLDSLLK